jgi:non-ribosomal peptide synthetase component F/aryl carrier-like protein
MKHADPSGDCMLSISHPLDHELQAALDHVNHTHQLQLEISMKNAPGKFIVSSFHKDLVLLEQELVHRNIKYKYLRVRIPFHSRALDPYFMELEEYLEPVLDDQEVHIPVLDLHGNLVQCTQGSTVDLVYQASVGSFDFTKLVSSVRTMDFVIDFGPGGNHGIGRLFSQSNLVLTMDDLEVWSKATCLPTTHSWDREIQESGDDHLEQRIQRMIANLLHVEQQQVDVNKSLYEYGLDSLAGTVLVSELAKQGLEVSAADIFKHDTVRKLSLVCKPVTNETNFVLEKKQYFETLKRNLVTQDAELDNVFLPSALQLSMISATLNVNPSLYVSHLKFKIHQGTDMKRLLSVLSTIISSNDILRSGFIETNDLQIPYVRKVYPFRDEFLLNDMKPLSSVDDLAKEGQTIVQEVPFRDLKTPPLRFQTYRIGSETYALISMHHSIYDGWSVQLLLEDLQRGYEGFSIAPRPSLEDFIWELYDYSEEAEQTFWNDMNLVQPDPFPNLSNSSSGTIINIQRNSSFDIAGHMELAKELKVTVQAIVQLAWAKVLSQITHSSIVQFGQVLSGRNLRKSGALESLAPFLNTLPVQIDVTESRSNHEIILALHELYQTNLDHVHIPLRNIQKWIAKQHLFDTLFLFQPQGYSGPTQTKFWSFQEEFFESDYPLTLKVHIHNGKFVYEYTAHEHRIDYQHSELILDLLDYYLLDIVHPHSIPNALLAMTPVKAPALHDSHWVHEYVGVWAEKNPEHIAIEYLPSLEEKVESITYGDLERLSNQVAHYLIDEQIGRDDIVMISMERSVFLYAIMFGILKAGGAYCFLEPKLPHSRKEYMIENSGSKIILCSYQTKQSISVHFHDKVRTVLRSDLKEYPTTKPNMEIHGSDLAYVIYTSGSTGVPKGVMVEHENVRTCMNGFDLLIPLEQHHRFLQFASLSFDASVFDIFYAFMKGACLVTATQETILADIIQVTNRLKVTHMDLTPTVCSLIPSKDLVPTVEVLISAGEAVTQQVVLT